MNKEQIFELLDNSFNEEQGSYLDSSPLNHLSKQDAGDPKFMFQLVSEFIGFEEDILHYLEEPAKSDVDFLEKCIRDGKEDFSRANWSVLKYASEKIRNDSSLFLKWIKESSNLKCLNFAEFSLSTHEEIQTLINELLETDWNLIKYCPPSIRGDIEIMTKAISHNGLNLEFASDELKQNKDLVLIAVEEREEAVKFVPLNLFESETFVIDMIERLSSISSATLDLIPEQYKKNKALLIKIAQKVRFNWLLDGYFDPDDREFFSEVVKKNGDFIGSGSEKLRDDEELVKMAIKFGDGSLDNVSERLRNDPEMVIWAIKNNRPALFRHAGESAHDNFDVAMTAVSLQGSALDWASKRLRDNDEIVSQAVNEDPYALRYASNRIRNDKAFVLSVCEKEIHAYTHAGDSLWSDKDFALFVVSKVVNSIFHFSEELQDDPDVIAAYDAKLKT